MSEGVKPGAILAGKYIVEKVLGQGGMGVVVAGRHVQLGHRVAIKFLLSEAAHHPEATARFLREAQASVQIQSEHVARVSDVGTLDDGAPYMVMEFLSGSDLGQVLAARGSPFVIEEAVDYLLQACEAIAEAHALGIVHRDLKPANLFLTRRADGSALVKVLDFGISKVTSLQNTAVNMTATATVMGSPAYMSPEQVRSAKHVDARTDIWALGMILYEFLARRPAFEAETVSGLLAQIVADPPTPLRTHRPDIPPRLEAVVMRCLEKDAGRRMADVVEFAQALAPFSPASQLSVNRIRRVLRGANAIAVPEAPPRGVSSDGSHRTLTVDSWGSTENGQGGGRRRTWLVAALTAGTLAGLASAYYALHVPTDSPSVIVAPTDTTATGTVSAAAAQVPHAPSLMADPPAAVATPPEGALAPRGGPIPIPPPTVRAPARAGSQRVGRGSPAPAATASAKPNKDLFDDIN